MAQSGEQFTGGEGGSGPREDSGFSVCGMNKVEAPLTPEADVKHDYQLQEMCNNSRHKKDANLNHRLLQEDERNEDCQVEGSYKRNVCEQGSCQSSPSARCNEKEQNEANKNNHLLKSGSFSPAQKPAINEQLHKGEVVYRNGNAFQSGRFSSSSSPPSSQLQQAPVESYIGSPLEEVKMCRGYDIQTAKQTNTNPQALPSSPSSTSLSISRGCVIAGPHYSHISPAEEDGRSAANDIRDDDRLCRRDEREMEQIESVCNSIEKEQEKGDWQQALQLVKEDDPHLQTNQGTVVHAKLSPFSLISVTSVLSNVRKVIAICFHPQCSLSIEKTLSGLCSVCYLILRLHLRLVEILRLLLLARLRFFCNKQYLVWKFCTIF